MMVSALCCLDTGDKVDEIEWRNTSEMKSFSFIVDSFKGWLVADVPLHGFYANYVKG